MPHTIKPVPMFHTPENWNELHAWIERQPPADRAAITTAALMAWNLAAKLTARPETDSKE